MYYMTWCKNKRNHAPNTITPERVSTQAQRGHTGTITHGDRHKK